MNGVLIFLAVSSGLPVNSPSSANWMSDYREAYKAAKENDRQLLVVLENPSDPEFQPARFSKQESVDESLEPYELCRVDVSTSYGKKVANAFRATEFPYTAITDKGASNVVYRHSGKVSDDEWKTTLVTYKNAVLVSKKTNQYINYGTTGYYNYSYQPNNTYYAPTTYYYQRSSAGCST